MIGTSHCCWFVIEGQLLISSKVIGRTSDCVLPVPVRACVWSVCDTLKIIFLNKQEGHFITRKPPWMGAQHVQPHTPSELRAINTIQSLINLEMGDRIFDPNRNHLFQGSSVESRDECLEEMPRESVFSVYMQCVLPHKLSYAFSLILLEANDRQLAVSFMCYACHYVVLPELASLWCSCISHSLWLGWRSHYF